MCQVSAKTSLSYFDVGVSCSPSNKTICSFLVDILLLLATETLNVNDNMMYQWVKLVHMLSLVALLWHIFLT